MPVLHAGYNKNISWPVQREQNGPGSDVCAIRVIKAISVPWLRWAHSTQCNPIPSFCSLLLAVLHSPWHFEHLVVGEEPRRQRLLALPTNLPKW